MTKRIELIPTKCLTCKGGGTVYVPPNLLGWVANGEDPGDREEDCETCNGSGWGEPRQVEFDR